MISSNCADDNINILENAIEYLEKHKKLIESGLVPTISQRKAKLKDKNNVN
jgi:hypothetical protein